MSNCPIIESYAPKEVSTIALCVCVCSHAAELFGNVQTNKFNLGLFPKQKYVPGEILQQPMICSITQFTPTSATTMQLSNTFMPFYMYLVTVNPGQHLVPSTALVTVPFRPLPAL